MLSHDDLIKKILENPNVKAEYDALENEFALLTEMIKARRAAGLSQQEVHNVWALNKPLLHVWNPLHKEKYSPNLATLQRYAHAIGCHLDIKFIPNSKNP